MAGLSRYGRAGDVRGFYGRLGITLPARPDLEAPVRCFADPAAHRRDDRNPSCSVNLRSGAFSCHACGARGGAYDAATSAGLSPRAAIDLMVEHGLADRRNRGGPNRRLGAQRIAPQPIAAPEPQVRASPLVQEDQLQRWASRLQAQRDLLSRLQHTRGWRPEVLVHHQVGWDGRRFTIPIRSRSHLVAVVRYAPPWSRRGPKMLALPGSRQALFPDPTALRTPVVWLVEGHPDTLAALSVGLPAVGLPGVVSWRQEWAQAFDGRRVVICLDCDDEGRDAAERVARDLQVHSAGTRVLDLDPSRNDGYDLSDALLAGVRFAPSGDRQS